MNDDVQVAGIIIPGADGDEIAGVIINQADGDDELADAQLDSVVGAERPPRDT